MKPPTAIPRAASLLVCALVALLLGL